VKVVSVVPGNPVGVVVVFDPDGSPLGMLDGSALTAIRTGAASGLMTDLLAARGARVMAMVGAGAIARDQVSAVRAVRPVDEVLVWSRTAARAAALAQTVGGRVVADVTEAVAAADIVTTATPSRRPLFDAAAVRPGTHINAVGAYTPEMVELPQGLLTRALVVVDDREAAAAEAGDLLQAGRGPDASAADVIAGARAQEGQDVTIFKSVGIASQDVAAGVAALEAANRLGLGVELGG
jgi:ornithine cyclodeaminase